MPKIFGTSLLGILAATVVFYVLGIIWYGFVFSEQWMSLNGITEAMAQAHMDKIGGPVVMYGLGFLITLIQVLGLAYVLNHASASLLGTCAKICALIAVLIALPIMMYGHLYEGTPIQSVGLDFGHMLIGYVLVGIVLSFFRGKDAIAAG